MRTRKTTTIIVSLFCAIIFMFAFCFAACGEPADNGGNGNNNGGNGNNNGGGGGSTVVEDYDMEYGDTKSLSGSVTIADTTIADYSGGVLTAKKVGETSITVEGKTSKLTVSPALVDVVLFTGQSNMVGSDTEKYTVDIPAGQAYEYKHSNTALEEVKNPSGESMGGYFQVSFGSSMVPQFCEDYVEKTGRKIVAVHAAYGGLAISDFTKGTSRYTRIVQKYKGCTDKLTADENFEIGRKFYIMFQGESDTATKTNTNGTSKEDYKTRYMNFHNGLKTDLGMEFGGMLHTGGGSVVSHEGYIRIAQAKHELAYENEDIIIVHKEAMTWYLHKPEYMFLQPTQFNPPIHFNAAGMQSIATSSCENVVNYLGYGEDKTKKGIDPVTYITELNSVTDVTFGSVTSSSVNVGSNVVLSCTVNGTDPFAKAGETPGSYEAIDQRLTWSSSAPAIATVENGVVTGVAEGTAVITAKSVADTTKTDTVTITVTATTPTPIPTSIDMEYGDTMSLSGNVTVANSTIAVYTNGVLTAKKVGETSITVGGQTATLTVTPAVVDVVLFTGQSNMVGRDTSKYTVDIPAGQAYEYKYNGDTLGEVKNPSGDNIGSGDGNLEVSSGSSMVPQFCKDYVESTGRKIVAVHAARGGKPIANFAQNGNTYPNIVKKYEACTDKLTADENFEIGRQFYIMFQGESDTENTSFQKGTTKEAYKTTYMSFHNGMKSLGMEFGGMLYTGRNSQIGSALNTEGIVRISQAKLELAYENDDIIVLQKDAMTWFDTEKNYMKSDNIHFTADAMKVIATSSCTNLVNYLGYGEDKTKKGIDPVTYLAEPNSVTGVTFGSATTATVVEDQSLPLSCTVNGTNPFTSGTYTGPYEAIDSRLTWSSSAPAIATVENGIVQGVKAGTAVITATSVADPTKSATISVTVTSDRPATESLYRWDFETDVSGTLTNSAGEITTVTATKGGTGTPTIADGKYTYADNDTKVWYDLDNSILLSKSKDWYVEWKGTCAAMTATGHSASIILGGAGDFTFITYQVANGIYVRSGQNNRAQFNDENLISSQYTEHTWRLEYSATTNKIALYLDGGNTPVQTLGWTFDLTVEYLLGRPTDNLHFTGSMDYIEIGLYGETAN